MYDAQWLVNLLGSWVFQGFIRREEQVGGLLKNSIWVRHKWACSSICDYMSVALDESGLYMRDWTEDFNFALNGGIEWKLLWDTEEIF